MVTKLVVIFPYSHSRYDKKLLTFFFLRELFGFSEKKFSQASMLGESALGFLANAEALAIDMKLPYESDLVIVYPEPAKPE